MFKDTFNKILKPKAEIDRKIFKINTNFEAQLIKDSYMQRNRKYMPIQDFDQHTLTKMGIIDKYGGSISATHRLVVRPSFSNVLLVYKITKDFLENLEMQVKREPQFPNFLDVFIRDTYLPHIEKQMNNFYVSQISGLDSFQADRYSYIPFPLIKSALHVVILARNISYCVNKLPSYKSILIDSLLEIFVKYHEKCNNRYQGIII
jgi:hypothetical protein